MAGVENRGDLIMRYPRGYVPGVTDVLRGKPPLVVEMARVLVEEGGDPDPAFIAAWLDAMEAVLTVAYWSVPVSEEL